MAKETQANEAQTENKEEIKNIVNITDAGPCKKKISVEIPAEKITKVLDEQYKELGMNTVVPGFRKGRCLAGFSKSGLERKSASRQS